MPQASSDLQQQVRLMLASIPEEVRKDAEEVQDRAIAAAELIRKSQVAATPGEARQIADRARRILRARPRAEVEQSVVATMAKAKRLGDSPQAIALVRQAREELLDNLPAQRRHTVGAVAKATPLPQSGGLVALYGPYGELFGVCPAEEYTPVTTRVPADPATDALVAKGAAAARVPAKDDPAAPQRYCLGIAYQPGKDPRISKGQDGGRDWISEAELERAAHSFLTSGPRVGLLHADGTDAAGGAAQVVESYIWRGPDWDLGDGTVVTKGTWLIGAILTPRAWEMVQKGLITGWSPQGTATRRRPAAGTPATRT